MDINLMMTAGAAAAGAAAAVWAVFRVMLAAQERDVLEVKASVLDAHRRINHHIEAHHTK